MSLLWAVPVVAVAVGAALLLAWARTIEQASLELLVATRRTRELRRPLAELRGELHRTGPLVDRVWAHWDAPDAPDDADGPGDRPVTGPDPSG